MVDPEEILKDYLIFLPTHRPITADQGNRLLIVFFKIFIRILQFSCLEVPTCNTFFILVVIYILFHFIQS